MSSPPLEMSVAAGRPLRIDSRHRWFPDLRAFFGSKQLIMLLCRRNVTVLYRQTVLGAVWVVVSPLLSAGLFTFVFGRVAHLKTGGVPYFAFSYAGLLTWNLFSGCLTSAATSLVANSSLFTRIHFSRLVLPVSQLAQTMINTCVSVVVMAVLLVVYHITVSFRLLFAPLWLLLALVMALGMSLILSSIAVLYRDVQYVVGAVVPMLMFLTPVAYASSAVPHSLRYVYLLNPIATIVEGGRWSLVGHTHLSMWTVAYTAGFSVVLLLLGLVVFARLEWRFADVV